MQRGNIMDIAAAKAFFMWCTIINTVLLTLSFLMVSALNDWMYGVHSKLFHISRETFNAALYSFMVFYKVMIMVFNLVPWIVLLIIG